MLNNKAVEVIKKYNLLQPKDTVIVGFSGGADSMALLHFLKFSLKDYSINVIACHINHCLRGDESIRDQEFAKDICEKLNIPLQILVCDIKKQASEQKTSIEECGRSVRYNFFNEIAMQYNGKIATAHTLSDKVETLIFNLTRGSSLNGLCSIPAKRDNIIRPLIACTRSDIENYCRENNLDFINDSTNFSTDFTRNKIRIEIIPKLCDINTGFFDNAKNLMDSLETDNIYLNKIASDEYKRIVKDNKIIVSELIKLDKAIICRIIFNFLKDNSLEYNYKKINTIINMLNNSSGKFNIEKNKHIILENDYLTVKNAFKSIDYFEQEVQPGKNDLGFASFTALNYKKDDCELKIYKNLLFNSIDYDKIIGTLIVRQRKTGDNISIPNRGVTKSLKKLFIEDKIPLEKRDKILVFCDDIGVVYVEGYGVDRRIMPDENTENYLILKDIIKTI